jgi:histone-lysine N-methyltransferase SETD2
MQKFTKQLPKDDLKKFAKEVGKKLVASDFKNGRIDDPTKISEKQEKKVKAYVRQFFEKAVEKKKELDKRKKEKEKAKLANGLGSAQKVNGMGRKKWTRRLKSMTRKRKTSTSPPRRRLALRAHRVHRLRRPSLNPRQSSNASGRVRRHRAMIRTASV